MEGCAKSGLRLWAWGLDAQTTLPGLSQLADLRLYRARSQKVVPGVAKRWEISEDGLAVSLQLRRGLRFSDGRPLEKGKRFIRTAVGDYRLDKSGTIVRCP